jgi:hypothetical protein
MDKSNWVRVFKASEIEVLSNVLATLLKATKEVIHKILYYKPWEKVSQECHDSSEYFLELISVIFKHPSLWTLEEILHLPLSEWKTRAEIILLGDMKKTQEINSLLFAIDRWDFS